MFETITGENIIMHKCHQCRICKKQVELVFDYCIDCDMLLHPYNMEITYQDTNTYCDDTIEFENSIVIETY